MFLFEDILSLFLKNEIYEDYDSGARALRYALTNPSTGFLKPVEEKGNLKYYNENEVQEILKSFQKYKNQGLSSSKAWSFVKKDYESMAIADNPKITQLSNKSNALLANHLEFLINKNEVLQDKNDKLQEEVYNLKEKVNELKSYINNIEDISELMANKVVNKIKENE